MSQLYRRAFLVLILVSGSAPGDEQAIEFNRDIRPILAAKCFACHGRDEENRESELRMDVRQDAIDYGAIEPYSPDESEFIRRILSDDPDEIMPPPDANDALTEEQKNLFIQWVEQGAPYAEHWAFVSPTKPALPKVKHIDWPRNEIDHFVLARLEDEGLEPSPQANGYALIRRVYLDLIGLPPAPEHPACRR